MNALAIITTYKNEKRISYMMIALGFLLVATFVSYLVVMVSVTHTGYAITSTNAAETEFLETISSLENELATARASVVFEAQEQDLNRFEPIAQSIKYQTVNTETYSLARSLVQ